MPSIPHRPSDPQRGGDFLGRDLLTLSRLTREDLFSLFATARSAKADIRPYRDVLAGTTAVLLFEKPSLRTRITFETGIHKLGGTPLYMDHSQQRLGEREAVKDYGRNLERWVDLVIARVYSHAIVEELAAHADIPVINALSDREHPCQGLADLFTLWERPGDLADKRLAYVGDGNNVCHSLMHAACLLGVSITVITPKGRAPKSEMIKQCEAFAKQSGATLRLETTPAAVEGHHAVYTDVWTSMGDAKESLEATRAAFQPFQINAELMARASKGIPGGSLFMHCLPAQRGREVTDEVIDSPNSIVYDQAENRLHAQNGLLIQMFQNT